MLDYVIDLLDDATDFSWASAKASHAVLLCRMEQGEIGRWLKTKKIDRVRRAHAQRHNNGQSSAQIALDNHSSTKIATCIYYNKGVFIIQGHGGRVVTLSPPTSEAGVRSPSWPQVGKLVVACRWSAVYSKEP